MGSSHTQEERIAHLVVLGLESPAKAEEVFDLAGDLADVGINVDTIEPYNPTVIQTNLTKDREEELVKALQS